MSVPPEQHRHPQESFGPMEGISFVRPSNVAYDLLINLYILPPRQTFFYVYSMVDAMIYMPSRPTPSLAHLLS
jgi:hypothetical protein